MPIVKLNPPPKPFDSWFELDVCLAIAAKGYRVVPQYPIAGKLIDLVVEGEKSQLAVECDGDHWHGPEQYEADMERQRKLERAGWQFFRIRECLFNANRESALEGLWARLWKLRIFPVGSIDPPEEIARNEEKPSNENPRGKSEEKSSCTEGTPKVVKPGESPATHKDVFCPAPDLSNQDEREREKAVDQAVEILSRPFSPGQKAYEIKVSESIVSQVVTKLRERGIEPKFTKTLGQDVKVRVENPKS